MIVMSAYSYNPSQKKKGRVIRKDSKRFSVPIDKNRKETPKHNKGKKKNNPGALDDISERIGSDMLKAGAVTIIIILFAYFFLLSPMIGDMTMSSEDKELASQPDFPDLSKFEANKQYYLCQMEKDENQGLVTQYQNQMDQKESTLETCQSEKEELKKDLDEARSDASEWKTGMEECNESLSEKDFDLAVCEDDLNEMEDDLMELELEQYSIKSNYAKDYCCIYKTVVGDPDLKYYSFEDNKVICSDDPSDEEFSC